MKQSETAHHREETLTIRGSNFNGRMTWANGGLQLELIDFQQQVFYTLEVTDQRHVFFNSPRKLFTELSRNKKMEISDDGSLIIPIEAIYNGEVDELRLEVLLKRKQFKSEKELILRLYEEFGRVAEESRVMQGGIAAKNQVVFSKFLRDPNNPHLDKFQVLDNGNMLRLLTSGTYYPYPHARHLGHSEFFCFKFRVLRSTARKIFLGVCGSQIKQQHNCYKDPAFACLYLFDGYIYAEGNSIDAVESVKVMEGETVFEVRIDMTAGRINWLQDGKEICEYLMSDRLRKHELHPVVYMCEKGDYIEFQDK